MVLGSHIDRRAFLDQSNQDNIEGSNSLLVAAFNFHGQFYYLFLSSSTTAAGHVVVFCASSCIHN